MQTRPRRIIPLRRPASDALPAQDCAPAVGAARVRLQATFASFYNALFDAACVANDEQRHEHTIELLRAVKAQESAIIAGICADVARSADPGEAPEARWLAHALARHCAALPLEPGELALLQAACAEQMLAPQERPRTASAAPVAAGERDSAARLVARLRAVGLELEPGIAADGADCRAAGTTETIPAPAAVAQEPRGRVALRAVTLALVAAALVALSVVFLEPINRAIRPLAAAASRGLPPPAPKDASVVAHETQQAAAPQRPTGEPALVPGDSAPVTGPAPAAEPPPAAVRAPEAPAVAAQIEAVAQIAAVAAPAREVPPAAAARLATQVGYLLRRGDAALAELRLAEPYADSAAANYAAVLAIDAANAEARQGQERIVAAYVRLAQAALQRGDPGYAQQLLARARTVLPESAALQQLEQEITNAGMTGR